MDRHVAKSAHAYTAAREIFAAWPRIPQAREKVGLFLIIDPPGADYYGSCEVRHVNKYDIAQGHLFASNGMHGGKRVVCKRVTGNNRDAIAKFTPSRAWRTRNPIYTICIFQSPSFNTIMSIPRLTIRNRPRNRGSINRPKINNELRIIDCCVIDMCFRCSW